MFKMLLLNCVFLIAVANKISGMASLGNGSMKKVSVRAKIAKFCGQNPALCRFKMEMLDVKRSANDRKIYHQDVEKEFHEEEEDPRQEAIKIISKSNMLCHFTDKANSLIAIMANNMKKKVNDIILDIKSLIQDLLLLPQAIIVCQPRVQKDNTPRDKAHPHSALNIQDGLHDVKNPTKDGSLNNLENDIKNTYSQKDEISANRDFAESKGNVVEALRLNENNPQNLPWKDVEYQHFKRLYHDLQSNYRPSHQSLPWKDESKTQKQKGSSDKIKSNSSPINLPWDDMKERRERKGISNAIKSVDTDAEREKIMGLLEDILRHSNAKVDQKSV